MPLFRCLLVYIVCFYQPFKNGLKGFRGRIHSPHIKMTGRFQIADRIILCLKQKRYAVIHPRNNKAVTGLHLIPRTAAKPHADQNRVNPLRHPFQFRFDMFLHFSRIPVINPVEISDPHLCSHAGLCRFHIFRKRTAGQYDCLILIHDCLILIHRIASQIPYCQYQKPYYESRNTSANHVFYIRSNYQCRSVLPSARHITHVLPCK